MVGNYKVITLCGSTRFKNEFMEVQKKLTLAGNIVISVGLFGHSGDNEVWEGMSEDTLTKTKIIIDCLEYAMIYDTLLWATEILFWKIMECERTL